MGRSGVRAGSLIVLTSLMVFSFQNCSSFKSSHDSLSSSSAQCKAQLKADVTAAKIPASELNCSDFNNFGCERRIFSPDVQDLTHVLKECLPGDRICVDVDVRQYNTSGARTPASEAQFEPGGDYNREDVRCFHKMTVRGLIIFDGEGDDIASALSNAMQACEAAQGGV